MSEKQNRTERRAEARKLMRNKNDTRNSKLSYARKKERLERQYNAEEINRRRAMTCFGFEPPPKVEPMDALFDFTLNEKGIGYGWIGAAVILLMLVWTWQAWGARKG